MLPAASTPAGEINGQSLQAYLSPKLQRPPVTPQGPKSALHTLLLTAALIFAAATVVYSCVWMYYVRLHPHVELGMDTTLFSSTEVSEITLRSVRKAGVTVDKIDHVAVHAITTLGFPAATRAMTWVSGNPRSKLDCPIEVVLYVHADKADPIRL